MRRITGPAVLACILALACGDSPTAVTEQGAFTPSFDAGPASTQTTNEFFPVNISAFIPCALDGVGEVVILSGTLHNLTHWTRKGDRETFTFNSHPQQMSGYGETSGDMYRAGGVSHESIILNGVEYPYTMTIIGRFIFIGQGPGNNLRFLIDNHITINANGETTTEVDNVRMDCK